MRAHISDINKIMFMMNSGERKRIKLNRIMYL